MPFQPFGALRMRNIFDRAGSVTNPEPEYDVRGRMSELYSPESFATERLNQMFQQFPQRNKPSFLRRIGAALSSISGGPEVGERQLYKPYYEAMEDWKTKIGPVSRAAEIEKSTNVNERQFAYQTIASELRNKSIEARERNDERNALIRQQRADVYQWKAQNPDLKFNFDGPTVTFAHPKTGQITDTKVPTGNLSDADKIALQGEAALEQIGARGTEQRKTEGIRQEGRETLAETRGWKIYNIPDPTNPGQQKAVKINEITGEVKDLSQSVGLVSRTSVIDKELMPTQIRTRTKNIIDKVLAEHPEWEMYVDRNTGLIRPVGTGTGKYDLTQEVRNRIVNAIYGENTPAITQPKRTGSIVSPEPAKTGKIRVRAPDGRTGTWDLSKGPIPSGFIKVE